VASRLYTSIPVRYIIETKSDWTIFSIIGAGFWWSDIEVEYSKGRDKLTQDVVFSNNLIKIIKNGFDHSLVKIAINCRLNIDESNLNSPTQYRIEKGDIEYTLIKIIANGKEVECLENKGAIPGNPRNPKDFAISVKTKRPRSGISARILMSLKILVLFVVPYASILGGAFAYCIWLSLDFLEFARANPYILILGGTVLAVPTLTVATKRNWV
jgi:hypothetical protein